MCSFAFAPACPGCCVLANTAERSLSACQLNAGLMTVDGEASSELRCR